MNAAEAKTETLALSRATDRAFYDADVLVIGAGPAGLSAALRVRWVKGYRALVSSVVVFDPGTPGGLLRWGGCILTGPAWASSGEELNARLQEDIRALNIPVVQERVVEVSRTGGGFSVTLASGARWTGRTVILATGFRAIGEEGEHYLAGVRVTFKGYDYFPGLIRAAARDAGERGLLVVGHGATAHLAPMFGSHADKTPLTFLLEGPAAQNPPALESLGTLKWGRLAGVEKGETGVEAAQIQLATGARERHPCGAILLDYNAFELRPVLEVGGVLPTLDARGFVQVDAWMGTSEPGIFAAGDITGRYAATLVALGDGVTAGFSAHRFVYRGKFGEEPHLFAYRALDETLPAQPRDLPVLPADAVPIRLGDLALIRASGPVGEALDDRCDVGTLRAQLGAAVVDEALDALIAQKDITVHRSWQDTGA